MRSAFQDSVLFAFGAGDPRITLALLDGPVDRTHDCFRGARLMPLPGVGLGDEDSAALARGTYAASIIFGQPCSSIEGIAPLCRGVLVPIFSDSRRDCSQRDLGRAMLAAIARGAQAIQIGGGRFEQRARLHPSLAEALAICRARGILIVSARGREGCPDFDDAGDAPVLSVGALGEVWRFYRMRSPSRRRIGSGVVIPAANVLGAALQGDVAWRGGANAAASLVTGIVGVLLTHQVQAGVAPDALGVRDALIKTSARRDTPETPIGQRLLIGRAHVQRVIDRLLTGAPPAIPAFPFGRVLSAAR